MKTMKKVIGQKWAVSQAYLIDYKELDDKRLDLGRQVRSLDSRCKILKEVILATIKEGKPIEPGDMVALRDDGKRNVAWKEEFEKLCIKMGLDPVKQVQAIVDATDPSDVLIVASIAKGIKRGDD